MKNSSSKSIQGYGVSSVAFAVPWCCVVPAVLAVLGLAGTAAMRLTLMKYTPALLVFSALSLGRANLPGPCQKTGEPGKSPYCVDFNVDCFRIMVSLVFQ